MIDERLNFNQNGAWSIFREVNRLISQALLPSSLSHSPLLFPLHMTTSDTGTPFVYFPSAPLPSPFLPHHTPLIPLPYIHCNQSRESKPALPLQLILSAISHNHMKGNFKAFCYPV